MVGHHSGPRQDQQTSLPLLDSREGEWSRITVGSEQFLNLNERLLRQTTGFNDHDQYGANMNKNCSTGSARQFSGLSNDQPVGLSFWGV